MAMSDSVCQFFCEAKCCCHVFCKLCLKSFGSEDPRPNKQGQALQRTANRGLVCDCCRNALNFKHAADSPQERKSRIEEIAAAKKEGKPHEHDGEREQWLAEHAASGGVRIQAGPRTTCKVSGSSSMGLRRGHGYIWTPQQWANFFEKPVDWTQVKTYNCNGLSIRGILEPPTKGWIPGLYELFETHESKSKMETTVADTAVGNTLEDVQAAHKALSTARTLTTEITTNDKGQVVGCAVEAPGLMAHKDDDDSDDDSHIDLLCRYASISQVKRASSSIAESEPASTSSTTSKKSRKAAVLQSTAGSGAGAPGKRTHSQGDAQEPTATQKKRKTPGATAAFKEMSVAKMTNELRATELVFVEVRQALDIWAGAETWISVAAPRVKTLVSKLDKRLQPKILDQFSLDAVTCEGGLTPVVLHQVLLEHNQLWKALLDILLSYYAKVGDVVRVAASLKSAVVVFEGLDLAHLKAQQIIPNAIYFEITTRAASSAMKRALAIVTNDTDSVEDADEDLLTWAWTLRHSSQLHGDSLLGISFLARIPSVGEVEALKCQIKLLREGAKEVFGLASKVKETTPAEQQSSFWASKATKFVASFCDKVLTVGIESTEMPRIIALQTLTKGSASNIEDQQAALKNVQNGTCIFEKETRLRYAAQVIQWSHMLLEKRIRDRQSVRGFELVATELTRLPDETAMEKLREPDADMKRVTDQIKSIVLMYKQVLAKTSAEARETDDFAQVSGPIMQVLTERCAEIQAAVHTRWNYAFHQALSAALRGEDVASVESFFDNAIALAVCVDMKDLVLDEAQAEAQRKVGSARVDVSQAAKLCAKEVLSHGNWEQSWVTIGPELEKFVHVALQSSRPESVYTDEAWKLWTDLVTKAIAAIEAGLCSSISAQIDGDATYGLLVDVLGASGKATLQKAWNATQSPKHLEFDNSLLRELTNEIVRHRLDELLFFNRKAFVPLKRLEDEMSVSIDLALVLRFPRLGDAIRHVANIGHRVRNALSLRTVSKQLVKLLEVSEEYSKLDVCLTESCTALPDNARLAELKTNTLAFLKQQVVDGTSNTAALAISTMTEAMENFQKLDFAAEIEKVENIDEALQDKTLERLATKEAQLFKAAFLQFDKSATLPVQIHKNLGITVSLETDEFYASLQAGLADVFTTITSARTLQAQALVAEAALSEPRLNRTRSQMLDIAKIGVQKIGGVLSPKFQSMLQGTMAGGKVFATEKAEKAASKLRVKSALKTEQD